MIMQLKKRDKMSDYCTEPSQRLWTLILQQKHHRRIATRRLFINRKYKKEITKESIHILTSISHSNFRKLQLTSMV